MILSPKIEICGFFIIFGAYGGCGKEGKEDMDFGILGYFCGSGRFFEHQKVKNVRNHRSDHFHNTKPTKHLKMYFSIQNLDFSDFQVVLEGNEEVGKGVRATSKPDFFIDFCVRSQLRP